MSHLQELIQNIRSTYHLQRRYYWLNTSIGFVAAFISIPLVLAVGDLTASWLGIPSHGIIHEHSRGATWTVLFFLSIPVLFLSVGVVVASVAGVAMVLFGVLSSAEAKNYVLRSRYPARWFKPESSEKAL